MSFMLKSYEVPSPPHKFQGTPWVDILRWMICVMNPDDRSLHFIAGVLSSALKNERKLSCKQAAAADKILQRVMAEFEEGILDCQLNEPPEKYDLANLEAKGEA